MLNTLRRCLDNWLFWPRLDQAQVEINTVCHNACVYCPLSVFGHARNWPKEEMTLETFRRILPDLARALKASSYRDPLLHLQGWGEPLLHPDFLEMLSLAKARKLRVSTTSCGRLIDEEMAENLVRSGLDHLTVSVAGVDTRQDKIRRGTKFETILQSIEILRLAKERLHAQTPVINVAYMMLASMADDAARIPDVFAGRGIRDVVVSTLTYAASGDMAQETIRPQSFDERRDLCARLDAIGERAAANGLGFHYNLPLPEPFKGLCPDGAQDQSIVVLPDGTVSPCIMARFDTTTAYSLGNEPIGFGNLKEQSLKEIWWNDDYVRFRASFWAEKPPARCTQCAKLGMA